MKWMESQKAMKYLRKLLTKRGEIVSNNVFHDHTGPFFMAFRHDDGEGEFCVYEHVTVEKLMNRRFKIPVFLHNKQFISNLMDKMRLEKTIFSNCKRPLQYCALIPEDSACTGPIKYLLFEYPQLINCTFLIDSTGAIRRPELPSV